MPSITRRIASIGFAFTSRNAGIRVGVFSLEPMLALRPLALRKLSGKLWRLKKKTGAIPMRFILAIVAGLLLAASFPNIGIAGFAWTAPALMFIAGAGCCGRDAFRVGYAAGLAFYIASLHWLLFIPAMKLFPILGWLALSGYLAIYPAAWVWLMATASGPLSQVSSSSTAEKFFVVATLERISAASWSHRLLWALSGAALWVALEMVLSRLLTGFPWLLLGISQQPILPLTQIASLTGVYGISFLVVWVSLALVCAAARIVSTPARRGVWMSEIILPLVAVVAVLTFGFHQLSKRETPAQEITVTFIQPSIPQRMIWDRRENATRFRQLLDLTKRALAETKPDLLLWPEAAVPEMLRYDAPTYESIADLARRHNVWMILGSDDAEPKLNSANGKDADYFNCGFLVSPRGEIVSRYKKQRLVIFGEYVPLARILPFLKFLTPISGSFSAGDAPAVFEIPERGIRTSILICFEDVFAQLTRACVSEDTDVLVNLTNDGWFGESSEQWQHAAAASFRSIENGVPLLRCCNNGISCWIDSNGRFRKILVSEGGVTRRPDVLEKENSGARVTRQSKETGNVYGAGFLSTKIPLLSEKREPTFYNRHGDWFGWGCVAASVLLIIRTVLARSSSISS